jgi:heme-degrading monooxygenase HmoA
VFIELQLHTPLEGRGDDALMALHETARRLKSEHGLRQVAVLQEENGRMGLMTTWESRDAWSGARATRDQIAKDVDMSCVDPAASNALLLSET